MKTNTEQQIKTRVSNALELIKPYLQADGGDIELVEITQNNVVKVRLQGACHSCPMSMQTLKAGVEQTVKRIVPEIDSVVAVDMYSDF